MISHRSSGWIDFLVDLDAYPLITKGTSALLSRWVPETVQSDEATAKRMPALKAPERAAKISASKLGKPRPAHVIEALRNANKGRKLSADHRRKMSEAHKRRGTRPPAAGVPWTNGEHALLGTMKDRDVAARTGRTEEAVSARRYVFGVAAFVKRSPPGQSVTWTPAKDRLLGTMPDGDVARKLRCTPAMVVYRRKRLGVAAYRGEGQRGSIRRGPASQRHRGRTGGRRSRSRRG